VAQYRHQARHHPAGRKSQVMEQTLLQPGKYLVRLMQQVTQILALLAAPMPEKRTLLLENCLLDQSLKTCPPLYKRACR